MDAKLKNSFILTATGAAVAAAGTIDVFFDVRHTERAEIFCTATTTQGAVEFDVTTVPPDAGSGTIRIQRALAVAANLEFDPHLLIEGKKRVTVTLTNAEAITAADLELFVVVKVYANE